MGRALRVLVEGGLYHVYIRVARGEPVFGDEAEAGRFVAQIREVKRRDGFSVLAWCVMSTHFLCAAAHKKCYAQPSVM
jgi:REP element-mobilizing transposase RayT